MRLTTESSPDIEGMRKIFREYKRSNCSKESLFLWLYLARINRRMAKIATKITRRLPSLKIKQKKWRVHKKYYNDGIGAYDSLVHSLVMRETFQSTNLYLYYGTRIAIPHKNILDYHRKLLRCPPWAPYTYQTIGCWLRHLKKGSAWQIYPITPRLDKFLQKICHTHIATD